MPDTENGNGPRKMTGLAYGRPKRGKTLGLLKAALHGLVFDAGTGADAIAYLGLDNYLGSRLIAAPCVHNATEGLQNYGDKFGVALVDDFTHMCKNTVAFIHNQIELPPTQRLDRFRHLNPRNKFAHGDAFNREITNFVQAMNEAKCDVLVSMHEQDEKEKVQTKGQGDAAVSKVLGVISGTVAMPGWQWPESFPGHFSFVAHIVHDTSFLGWPWVYATRATPEWIAGDRFDVTPPRCPQNLGEVWRAAGRRVPRPKGLEWMESVVEATANRLVEKHGVEDFKLEEFYLSVIDKIKTKFPNSNAKHRRWAMQDAMDRAFLKRVAADADLDWIRSVSGSVAGDV